MVRIPLRTQTDLPEEYQYLLDEDAMGEINLLSAMANNPDVLQSYMRYGTTLWTDSGIENTDVERCILAVARTLEAEYEWNQHVPIARDLGVPEGDIDAIASRELEHFDDRRRALLEYVTAVADGEVDAGTHEALSEHVGPETVVGVTQLAIHYVATARFVDVLEIPLDDPFVGWKPDQAEN